MEQHSGRRRRRRRRFSAGREATNWIMLIVVGVRKIYHWVLLAILVALILMTGFVFPAFA
jgi:hypothetical protein